MPVGMLLDTPEGSQDMYEALTTKIFGSLQPDVLPDGLIAHIAGPRDEGGWRVVDITDRAVEENAARIIELYEGWRGDTNGG